MPCTEDAVLGQCTRGIEHASSQCRSNRGRRSAPPPRGRDRHRQMSALPSRALADRRGAGTSGQHKPEQRRGSVQRATVKLRAWGIDSQPKYRKPSTCGGDARACALNSRQCKGCEPRRNSFVLQLSAVYNCGRTENDSQINTTAAHGVAQTGT